MLDGHVTDAQVESALEAWLESRSKLHEQGEAMFSALLAAGSISEPGAGLTPDEDARLEEQKCPCGRRNPVWHASNPAWNLGMGGVAEREAGGILCPTCFHTRWLVRTSGGNRP